MRLSFGRVELDTASLTMLRDGAEVPLQPLVARFLTLVVSRSGERVSTEEIREELWPDAHVTSHSLEQVAHQARRALGDDRDLLVTFPRKGYGFFAPVRRHLQGAYTPPPPIPLCGRAEEVAQAVQALRTHRVVTVMGPPGIGKTALLRTVAHAGRAAAWVDLEGVSTTHDVATRVLAALGHDLGDDAPGRVTHALASVGDALLVLDTCEDWSEAWRLAEWLAAAPDLTVLVGTRLAIGISAERALPLSPLSDEDAHTLLQQRCPVDRRTQDARVFTDLLSACHGLPLAIEVVAAHIRRGSPLGSLHVLEDERIAGALAWAWGTLDADDVADMEILCTLRRAFTFRDAASLLDSKAVVPFLEALLDRNLVREDGAGQLRLFGLVREYAEKITPPERWAAALDRHATWFLGRVAAAEVDHTDLADVAAALRHRMARDGVAATSPDIEAATAVLSYIAIGTSVVDGAFERYQGHERAILLRHQAYLEVVRGRNDEALVHLQSARRLLPGEDELGRLYVESMVWNMRRDVEAKLACERRLIELYEAAADARVTQARRNLAESLIERGQLSEAAVLIHQACDTARNAGDTVAMGRCLGSLGTLEMELGHPEKAIQHFRAAAAATEHLPNHHAYWLGWIGEAYADLGDHEQSVRWLGQSMRAFQDLGMPNGESSTRVDYSRALLRAGRIDEATASLERALEASRRNDRPLSIAYAEAMLSLARARTGLDTWTACREACLRVVALGIPRVALEVLVDWASADLPHRDEALDHVVRIATAHNLPANARALTAVRRLRDAG